MTGLELQKSLDGVCRSSVFSRWEQPRNQATFIDEPGIVYFIIKRALDIAVASLALIALTPLLAITALFIKRHDGGPILFAQTRIGKDGKPFRMYKFRSMGTNAEAKRPELQSLNHHQSSITFKIKDDPRITPIGRWIRKTSVDEMPQLWNILKGDMTLVGPRPAVPSEVAQYNSRERRRLEVTPGLTCLWQISGRADLPFPEQVRLDIQYIESQSTTLDLLILAKTPTAVLSGKGAY